MTTTPYYDYTKEETDVDGESDSVDYKYPLIYAITACILLVSILIGVITYVRKKFSHDNTGNTLITTIN